MRMLMIARFPTEPFNDHVRSGEIGQRMQRTLKAIDPEHAWFTEIDGWRTGLFVVDVKKPSDVPGLAEPLFLQFGADVSFHVAMTPDDLGKAGLEKLGETWG